MAEILDDGIHFAQHLPETEHPIKVWPATDFVDAAKRRMRCQSNAKRIFWPLPKCNPSFEFRLGEVSVLAVQNVQGNTDVTTGIVLSFMGLAEKVCVARFEIKPVTSTFQAMHAAHSAAQPDQKRSTP